MHRKLKTNNKCDKKSKNFLRIILSNISAVYKIFIYNIRFRFKTEVTSNDI